MNHKQFQIKPPVIDPKTQSSTDLPMQPSAYWGKEPIWDGHSSIHNAMMDSEGRVWFSARVPPAPHPEFCKKGSAHPPAENAPPDASPRPASVVDPQKGQGSHR